ncbi:MAG: WG repeat-containing protein [Oscillibacter sp.]|jgi:hypothetical protein|nr:WG repeat-containing protein [Oscillibacter sp.]
MRRAPLLAVLLAALLLSGCADTSVPSTSSSGASVETEIQTQGLPLAPVPLPKRVERTDVPENNDADFSLSKVNLPAHAIDPMIYGSVTPLIWYTDDSGKWGACDWDGTVLLDCRYDDAAFFCEDGVAAVQQGGLWGYVNLRGEDLLPCTHPSVAALHDEILLASDDSGAFTVYDLDGNALGSLPANIDSDNVYGGLIPFCDEASGLYGYLNADGSVAIPATYSAVYPFGNGLAAAQDAATGKKGFLDVSGQWAIPPRYDVVFHGYSGGYATVGTASEDATSPTGLCGLIDAVGNPASDADYLDITPFADGWAAYERDGSRGYLNKNNVEHDLSSLLGNSDTPSTFSGGYAVYTTPEGLCGYLDSDLNIAVPAQFSSCSKVVSGKALVQRTDGTICVLTLKN